MAVGGPQPQPLGHAGPEAFDQHVGARHQPQHRVAPGLRFQVQRHRAAVARVDIVAPVHRHAQLAGLGAVHAHHVGAQVGEQHRAKRPRADAGQFDDTQSVQWSHEWQLPRIGRGRGGWSSVPETAAAVPGRSAAARRRAGDPG